MAEALNRRLVVSAVNFAEGGPLTVLRECLQAASATLSDWDIVALVHDRALFDVPRVQFIEFRDSRRSWLRRLYYEFCHFQRLSEEMQPDVWLSLHDITPRVTARRRAVYCHNPAPFFRAGLREVRQDPKFFLFTKLYRYLYRINIHSNDLVIVQQDWIRAQFKCMYGVDNVVVAYPSGRVAACADATAERREVFLYPALPRTFKNFELLCEAAQLLEARVGAVFEVRLTVAGKEGPYAAELIRRYGKSAVIKFIGRQEPVAMARQYRQAAVVVFPSLLETWGLPISEGKSLGKVLLLADLPYAHETLGNYDRAAFFDPHDAPGLAALMQQHLRGELIVRPHTAPDLPTPFAPDWRALLAMVVGEDSTPGPHVP